MKREDLENLVKQLRSRINSYPEQGVTIDGFKIKYEDLELYAATIDDSISVGWFDDDYYETYSDVLEEIKERYDDLDCFNESDDGF